MTLHDVDDHDSPQIAFRYYLGFARDSWERLSNGFLLPFSQFRVFSLRLVTSQSLSAHSARLLNHLIEEEMIYHY